MGIEERPIFGYQAPARQVEKHYLPVGADLHDLLAMIAAKRLTAAA
jgi:hypothetical protein